MRIFIEMDLWGKAGANGADRKRHLFEATDEVMLGIRVYCAVQSPSG